jgi:hypothetical protein
MRVVDAGLRCMVDQKTLQPPLFQQPAPGSWMALSGVTGRKTRRMSDISWERRCKAKCRPRMMKRTLLRSRISHTRSMNVSVTLIPSFADVSTNRHPSFSAMYWPSARARRVTNTFMDEGQERMVCGVCSPVRKSIGRRQNEIRRTDLLHYAFALQVTFVPDDDDGDRLRIFDSQDLSMVRLDHLKRVSFRDGVHEEKALAVEHIVLPHRTVPSQHQFFLSTRRRHKIGDRSEAERGVV